MSETGALLVRQTERIATLESEVAALKHDIERSTQRNSDLLAENEALRAQLAQHKASLPTCEKHKPDRGARSSCVICAGHALSHALSRIDYACGEPNEMECSDYDLHQNEGEVVKRVVALRAQLALGDDRYEFVRRLNPRQFAELYQRNISENIPFDELVDAARIYKARMKK